MALPERTTGGPTIWSMGYAADEAPGFLRRLAAHGIVQIADIRTNAWSRYQTDFRRGTIERLFSDAGVAYRFFGEGLGGKPDDEERLTDGRPDDGKILDDPRFESELTALIQWAQESPHCVHVRVRLAAGLPPRATADPGPGSARAVGAAHHAGWARGGFFSRGRTPTHRAGESV